MVSLTDRLTAVEYSDLEAESVKVETHYGRIQNDFAENDGLRVVFPHPHEYQLWFKIGSRENPKP